MDHARSFTGNVRYGRSLVTAGITGIRAGQDSARGEQPLSKITAEAAQRSLMLAAVGACAGLLSSYLLHHRDKRISKAVALGSVGSALGFIAGFSWKTRDVTSRVVHSAAREVRRARDEHWLELNPIDYA